jgi:hypothetical protein
MQLFVSTFQKNGNTCDQRFLGTLAFNTTDPANLEAMMSTNFKGPNHFAVTNFFI